MCTLGEPDAHWNPLPPSTHTHLHPTMHWHSVSTEATSRKNAKDQRPRNLPVPKNTQNLGHTHVCAFFLFLFVLQSLKIMPPVAPLSSPLATLAFPAGNEARTHEAIRSQPIPAESRMENGVWGAGRGWEWKWEYGNRKRESERKRAGAGSPSSLAQLWRAHFFYLITLCNVIKPQKFLNLSATSAATLAAEQRAAFWWEMLIHCSVPMYVHMYVCQLIASVRMCVCVPHCAKWSIKLMSWPRTYICTHISTCTFAHTKAYYVNASPYQYVCAMGMEMEMAMEMEWKKQTS